MNRRYLFCLVLISLVLNFWLNGIAYSWSGSLQDTLVYSTSSVSIFTPGYFGWDGGEPNEPVSWVNIQYNPDWTYSDVSSFVEHHISTLQGGLYIGVVGTVDWDNVICVRHRTDDTYETTTSQQMDSLTLTYPITSFSAITAPGIYIIKAGWEDVWSKISCPTAYDGYKEAPLTTNLWLPSTTGIAAPLIQLGHIYRGQTIIDGQTIYEQVHSGIYTLNDYLSANTIYASPGSDSDTTYISSYWTMPDSQSSITTTLSTNSVTIIPPSNFLLITVGTTTVTWTYHDSPYYDEYFADDPDTTRSIILVLWSPSTTGIIAPLMQQGHIYQGHDPAICIDSTTLYVAVHTTAYSLYSYLSTSDIWSSEGSDSDTTYISYLDWQSGQMTITTTLSTNSVITILPEEFNLTEPGIYPVVWQYHDSKYFDQYFADDPDTYALITVVVYDEYSNSSCQSGAYPNPAWDPVTKYCPWSDGKPLAGGSVIDLTNGNITEEQILPLLPSRGLPVLFFRSNISYANESAAKLMYDNDPLPSFGRGGAWDYYQHIRTDSEPVMHGFDEQDEGFAEDTPQQLILFRGNHVMVAFERNTVTNVYESSRTGVTDKLYIRDSAYVRITPDGMEYYYATSSVVFDYSMRGKLWRVYDPHGNYIQCKWMNSSDLCITDASGHETWLTGNNKNIETIEDQTGRSASFAYEAKYDDNTYYRLISSSDFAGRVTNYSYTTGDRILEVDRSDWAHLKTIYQYSDTTYWKVSGKQEIDTLGNITVSWTYGYETATANRSWIIGPQNDTTYYWYNPSTWQMNRIQDALGHITRFEHDLNYNRLSATDAIGNKTRYTYDANNNLTSVTNALNQTAYTYWDTTYNLMTCAVDPIGNRSYYTWDNAKRDLLQAKDPIGSITQIQYNTYGNVTATIDPLSHRTELYPDSYSQVTMVVNPASAETTRFIFDQYGNCTTVVDSLGRKTRFIYDANRGILTSIIDALQDTTSYQYDSIDRLTTLIDAQQHKTYYFYDAFGNITTERDDTGNTNRYLNNVYGNLTTEYDPNGNTLWYWYNAIGQMTAKAWDKRAGYSFSNATLYFYYDVVGNATTMQDPNIGIVNWYYDQLSQVTTQVCSIGTIRYAYDANGQQIWMQAPDGNETVYYYDAAGNPYLVQNEFNQYSNYAQNSIGLVTQASYANSVFTDYAYDSSYRLAQIKTWKPTDDFNRPDNSEIKYRWNVKLGVWSIQSCQFDVMTVNNMAAVALDSSMSTQGLGSSVDVCFTSLSDGTSRNAFIIFGYNTFIDFWYAGAWINSNKWTIGHYHDGIWDDTTTVTKSFSTGRPYRMKLQYPTATDPQYRLFYWSNNNGWSEKLSISSTGIPFTKDGLGVFAVPNSMAHTRFDNYILNGIITTLQQYDYTYDKGGNRTQVADFNHNTTKYCYDTLDQLTVEQRYGTNAYKYTYFYDSLGNRTTMVYNNSTTVYGYNTLNQVTAVYAGDTHYYGYDENGNRSSEVVYVGGLAHLYVYDYDADNRLINKRAQGGGGDVSYTYCGIGKRVMKVQNGNTTIYYPDGLNTVTELYKASTENSFHPVAAYTLGLGAIGQIISVRQYGTTTTDLYYHYDPIGNVQFITDSYGNITVSYVQEGFGNVLASLGSLATNYYHLTTKELDPDTGLYYFGGRWYDPVIGRWITKEPTGIDGPNLYYYVSNNPIGYFDSDGLFTKSEADEYSKVYEGFFKDKNANVGDPELWQDFKDYWKVVAKEAVIFVVTGSACKLVTEHHLISRPILKALSEHQILGKIIKREDPEFIVKAYQKGYEQWHREYDKRVIAWVRNPKNKEATAAEFKKFLAELHQEQWLKTKVPGIKLK